MKALGEKLRAKREQLNLSISEVSIETKINGKVITAIEEGELSVLPAKTFLRGFIRTYATFLKMNIEDVLSDFHSAMGTTSPQPQEIPQPPVDISEYLSFFNNKLNRRKILLGIGIVSAIFMIVFVKNIYDKYEQEKAVTTISDIEAIEPVNKKKNSPVDQPAIVAEKPSIQVKKADNKISQTKVKIKDPLPAKTTTPVITKAKETISKPEVKKQQATKVEKKQKPKSIAKPQEVIIEALDKIEVEYRMDSGRLKSVTLDPDQTLVIKAKKIIAIDISDGGAVNIIHNGRDRGVPGDLGQPLKVKYP